jgi:phosphoribosylformylglycinamidine synthase
MTFRRPGAADAAIVGIEGTRRALALTTDCTPRYCQAHPETGGAQAVAEAWRNITATGATPLAITDNMNFGNPRKPEIMGQFAGCIRGMAAACTALDFPVISGNVSLYNETDGRPILPTPAIGGVGVIEDASRAVGLALPPGTTLLLLGETAGWLGQSLWLREIAGREEGAPPPVDLAAERRTGDVVRAAILRGDILACHDVSDGGVLVAAAEMALAGDVGLRLAPAPGGIAPHAFWFGEDQGRYLAATAAPDALLAAAAAAGIRAHVLGVADTQAGDLVCPDGQAISLAVLRDAHEATLPRLMGEVT